MDLIELAQQIAEMRGEFRSGRIETADALERIEGRMTEWPVLCAEHRAACATQRESAHATCSTATCARLVRVEEQAAAVGRARLISSWAWSSLATGGGIALAALGAYEVLRRLYP